MSVTLEVKTADEARATLSALLSEAERLQGKAAEELGKKDDSDPKIFRAFIDLTVATMNLHDRWAEDLEGFIA